MTCNLIRYDMLIVMLLVYAILECWCKPHLSTPPSSAVDSRPACLVICHLLNLLLLPQTALCPVYFAMSSWHIWSWSPFSTERTWVIRSGHSIQKSNMINLLISQSNSLFRSFIHKKQAICSKNQRVNSQPWKFFLFRTICATKKMIQYKPLAKY